MRIIHWADRFHPAIGGLEIMTDRLTAALAARGHEVAVVTDRVIDAHALSERRAGVQIIRRDIIAFLTAQDLRAVVACARELADFVAEFRPDVHHIHLGGHIGAPFLLSLIQNRLPCTTIATVHGAPAQVDLSQGVSYRSIKQMNRLVAVSEATGRAIAANIPNLAHRLTIIHNALDTPRAPLAAIPFSPPTIAYIGRLSAEKGVDLALDAMPELLSVIPDARLFIVGDGNERKALERQTAQLNIAANVKFVGWVHPDEIAGQIDRATVVVMPTRDAEGFGLAALQAAQRGRPVVAANVGGLPEVVLDEETGLLVPPERPDALAAALIRLLTEPEFCHRLGQRAQEYAAQRFSFSAHVDAYERLYRQVIEEGIVGSISLSSSQGTQ